MAGVRGRRQPLLRPCSVLQFTGTVDRSSSAASLPLAVLGPPGVSSAQSPCREPAVRATLRAEGCLCLEPPSRKRGTVVLGRDPHSCDSAHRRGCR